MNSKRLIFALTMLSLFSFRCFAQILNDTTVQIVAYWQAGDKYSFLSKQDKYKVDANNDTTIEEQTSETLTFEVMSQTKDTYHISLTYSDFQSTDKTDMMINDVMNQTVGAYSIEFETDELGTLKRFTNLQEIADKMKPGIRTVVDRMYAEDKDMKKVIPKKKMRDYLMYNTCTPEALMKGVLDDIQRLFFFHGAAIETTSTYTVDEQFASIFTDGDSLDCKTNFWIDAENTDSFSAVCRTYSEPANAEDLTAYLSKSIIQNVADLLPVDKKTKANVNENAEDIAKELASKMNITFEQYTTEEIHLNTGWFLAYYYDRFITIESEGKTTKTIHSRSLNMLK